MASAETELLAPSRPVSNDDAGRRPDGSGSGAKVSLVRNLLCLNGLAILAAVLNHAQSWGFTAMVFWTDRYRAVRVPNFDQLGGTSYFLLNGIAGAISFAIPSFLFITGVFTAIATDRSRATISWRTVYARVKFLFVPYLFWCGIAFAGLLVEGKEYSLPTYMVMVLTGKVRGPYYYVPLLIQLYILSLLIVPLARTHWKALLLSSAAVQLLVQSPFYLKIYGVDGGTISLEGLPQWFFLTRMFWFVLGVVVGFRLARFRTAVRGYRSWALGAAAPLLLVAVAERDWIFRHRVSVPIETLVGGLYAACVIVAVLVFTGRQPGTGWLEKVGSRSFGIYLAHVPVQIYTARIVYHLFPALLGYPVLFAGFIFAFGLLVPLCLIRFVEGSFARPASRYIFG